MRRISATPAEAVTSGRHGRREERREGSDAAPDHPAVRGVSELRPGPVPGPPPAGGPTLHSPPATSATTAGVPQTGDTVIDGALAELAAAETGDLDAQLSAAEELHTRLRARLSDLGE